MKEGFHDILHLKKGAIMKMKDYEITLDELEKRSNLNKRQIYNWQKAELLPEPIRREKTGQLEGEIVYYPIEAYHRLKSLKTFPISSVTKTIGFEGMFLPLFLFGFRDEKIDSGMKRLIKTALQYTNKHINKKLNIDSIPDLLNLPKEFIEPLLLKMTGRPEEEINILLPEETSDEKYDGIFDFGLSIYKETKTKLKLPFLIHRNEDVLHENFGMDEYENESSDSKIDLIDEFMISIQEVILKLPSLKKAIEQIEQFDKQELTKLQAIMSLAISLFYKFSGITPESFLKLFKKTVIIYSFCMFGFYAYKIFCIFESKIVYEIKENLFSTMSEIRKISMSEDEEVKTKKKQTKPRISIS